SEQEQANLPRHIIGCASNINGTQSTYYACCPQALVNLESTGCCICTCIKFRPGRPWQPHLNGKVSRAQQTDVKKFRALIDFSEKYLGNWLAQYYLISIGSGLMAHSLRSLWTGQSC
ncbi:MAG: hypothetical protein ONB05_12430, partial [candidate division KSB1 bacterium]|nr:hypothetical protein [candidate division KSB1 bacterium]